uniref:Uncharacterized protein n=1 Tax=Parastrongyloides trichosuri TaxID=131310 RepID=A0A0N4ZS85_PARTI
MSSGKHNYTLRTDIKNPAEAKSKNISQLSKEIQDINVGTISKKVKKEDLKKPFGTEEYNYTLTSPSSIVNNNSTMKSKRL